MKKIFVRLVLVLTFLFTLSVSHVLAQDACEGNFDCDQDNDVDGTDAAVFKADFGRNDYNNPCPTYYDSACPSNSCPYDMVNCGTKCVDPMTDEDFCGADSTCFGGTVCGDTEKCVSGVCEAMVASCDIPAPVPRTGQTLCYSETGAYISCAGTGQDGEYQKGVSWPNLRFTDNGDGTVTDNLTGLIWLKNANCFGEMYLGRIWIDALSDCNGLASGMCGLTDGSNAGDWRLPNRFELESLLDLSNDTPPLPSGHPFTNAKSWGYWSSTTYFHITNEAWFVDMYYGGGVSDQKYIEYFVWPVRDPL